MMHDVLASWHACNNTTPSNVVAALALLSTECAMNQMVSELVCMAVEDNKWCTESECNTNGTYMHLPGLHNFLHLPFSVIHAVCTMREITFDAG